MNKAWTGFIISSVIGIVVGVSAGLVLWSIPTPQDQTSTVVMANSAPLSIFGHCTATVRSGENQTEILVDNETSGEVDSSQDVSVEAVGCSIAYDGHAYRDRYPSGPTY